MTGPAVFKYFSLVGLAYVVATLGTGLTDYLTRFKMSMTTNLLLSSGIGLITAMSLGAIDLAKQGRTEKRPQDAPTPGPYPNPSGPYPGSPGPYPSSAPRSRTGGGAGLVVGAVALLILCAGLGYELTAGVQRAADKLSSVAPPPWLNETDLATPSRPSKTEVATPSRPSKTEDSGVERLAGQASKTSGPLTVTVLSVRVNGEATIVKITARNTGPDALTIPAFSSNYAQVTIPGGTLQPDRPAGDWPETVPAEGEATGAIVFKGGLPAGPAKITLSFSQILGSLNAPKNIAVTIPVN